MRKHLNSYSPDKIPAALILRKHARWRKFNIIAISIFLIVFAITQFLRLRPKIQLLKEHPTRIAPKKQLLKELKEEEKQLKQKIDLLSRDSDYIKEVAKEKFHLREPNDAVLMPKP